MTDQANMADKSATQNPLLSFWKLPCVLAGVVVAIDQVTKYYVVTNWPQGHASQVVVIRGFFNLVHFRNTGGAWGILPHSTGALSLISLAVAIVLVLAFKRLVESRPERGLALGLMLGGILGNLVDRLLRGEVVDFLLFFYRSFQWPAFNVADSAITCGVGLFILSSAVQAHVEPARPPEER